jgi:cytochrome b561
MQTTNIPKYSAPAKFFHWLTVLPLMIQYTIGWLMPDIGRDTQPVGLISWHLSIGALIVFPLMGWANASSRGWPVSLFGTIPSPALSSKGSQFGHALGDMHQLFARVLIAMVALHVAGALYHHFIVKDDTLRRMLLNR